MVNAIFGIRCHNEKLVNMAYFVMVVSAFVWKLYHPNPYHRGPLNDGNFFALCIIGMILFFFKSFAKYRELRFFKDKITYETKKEKVELDLKGDLYYFKVPFWLIFLVSKPSGFKKMITKANFWIELFVIITLFIPPFFIAAIFYYLVNCAIYKTFSINHYLISDKEGNAVVFTKNKQNTQFVNEFFNKEFKQVYSRTALRKAIFKGENNGWRYCEFENSRIP